MTDRWVCARCFTSAEESATVCPNCGLPRGTAPESAGQGTAAPDETETTWTSTSATPAPATIPTSPAPAVPISPSAAQPGPGTPSGGDERWVCRRCFNSNDGWRTACTNCGQPRNAPSPEAASGGTGWAPAQPASGGMRIPWRLVIYGVIALVVFGGSVLFAARRDDSGTITGAGNLSVFDLQMGDCFDAAFDPNEYTEISEVRAIPCTEPHVYEMYSVAEYPQGEAPSGPDEDYTPWETESCLGTFASYVGIDYNSSEYYISALVPTDDSWSHGDNTLMCFLHNDAETAVTGSARGAAR
jgi:Septum formation